MDAVDPALFARVTVVTQYPKILRLARELGFDAIENRHPDWGISHTIALGTAAMEDCDGILYLVSDQPLLSAQSVKNVVEAWQANPNCIVGAGHGGKRGNPNLFPAEFFPELMALEADRGGNQVIRRHEDRFLLVEIPQRELTDVDTRQAKAELEAEVAGEAAD